MSSLTPTFSQQQQASCSEIGYESLRDLANQNMALARIVAKNPGCPPKLLTQLSKIEDKRLQENIASNPNTEVDILWTLGILYPEKLLENPILELLLLENPNLFKFIPQATLLSLLKSKKLSEIYVILILKQRFDDETIVKAVLQNYLNIWNKWKKNHPQLVINLNKANLIGTNLRGADLSCINLRSSNLTKADLGGADLSNADLRKSQISHETVLEAKWRLVWQIVNFGAPGLDLRGADLSGANLTEAKLQGCDLTGADLSWANLWGADLRDCNLSQASLNNANLWEANLVGANLSCANLTGASLWRAHLNHSDLSNPDLNTNDLWNVNSIDIDLSDVALWATQLHESDWD